jgi:hypothetical protein
VSLAAAQGETFASFRCSFCESSCSPERWTHLHREVCLEKFPPNRKDPGGQILIARLKIDPVWDPIRNRPDSQQLLSSPEQVGPNE